MQQTKQKIIKSLKTNGGLTAGELSAMLGISATAVRRHLTTLEARNLICHRSEQRGMGRPSFVYELPDSYAKVFDQSLTAFVNSVVQELDESDGNKRPDSVFNRRQAKRHKQYLRLTTGETLTDRVACLARLMESEGRITTWQQVNETRFILRQHNCPFYRLNGRFDPPCRREISLLQKTLKADVQRVNHILKGDVACVYLIEGQRNGKNGQSNGKPVGVQDRHQEPLYGLLTY